MILVAIYYGSLVNCVNYDTNITCALVDVAH
jgi:hypothetical protein